MIAPASVRESAPPRELARVGFGSKINPALWVVACAGFALVFKLLIAFNTIGTNDVIRFYQFGASLTHIGLEETYRSDVAFNHPPLVSHGLAALYQLARRPFVEASGISFAFMLRLPGIVADFVVVCLLLRLRTQEPELRLPLWPLFVLALSPVSLMVSGFHGNTDSVMVLFLVLAAIAAIRHRPVWCGIFLALSIQIKIVPVFFVPAFLFIWFRHGRTRAFLIPLVLITLALWSEALLRFPQIFLKNVFGYGSFWGTWGITYLLSLTGWSDFARADFQNLSLAQNLVGILLKLSIVTAIVVVAYRRRRIVSGRGVCDSLATTWLIFFVLSPGIGAQYLVWIAPFVLLWSPQIYAWLTAASSLFLFVFYNTISGGLPWYYGLSNGKHTAEWLPWSIWPWMTLLAAVILLAKSRISATTALSETRDSLG